MFKKVHGYSSKNRKRKLIKVYGPHGSRVVDGSGKQNGCQEILAKWNRKK